MVGSHGPTVTWDLGVVETGDVDRGFPTASGWTHPHCATMVTCLLMRPLPFKDPPVRGNGRPHGFTVIAARAEVTDARAPVGANASGVGEATGMYWPYLVSMLPRNVKAGTGAWLTVAVKVAGWPPPGRQKEKPAPLRPGSAGSVGLAVSAPAPVRGRETQMPGRDGQSNMFPSRRRSLPAPVASRD